MTSFMKDDEQNESAGLNAKIIASWLRRNPEFFDNHPEVLTFLNPPKLKHGEAVVDLQQFMINRLQKELISQRQREKQILAAVEGNFSSLTKTHQAALAIISATDIHVINNVIKTKLPNILNVEAANLCIEEPGALALTGAKAIGPGGIINLMGTTKRFHFHGNTSGETLIFGEEANRVKSVAYLRLRLGRNGPAMLLALGSGRDDGFDNQQATDLLAFLGDILEVRIKQCLKLTK